MLNYKTLKCDPQSRFRVMRPIRAETPKRLLSPDIVGRLGRRRPLLLGRLVIEFDHDPVGVVHEYLSEIAARHLPGIEFHALGAQPLPHAIETAADEGNVMDNA